MTEMPEEIITKNQQKEIELTIDPSLQNGIQASYRNNTPLRFNFTLFNLIYSIGSCRSVDITCSNKFAIALDFVGIFADMNELRASIEDKTIEQKIEMSKLIGEGLSCLIAEKLYNIEKSTISRIKRKSNESKPDFQGYDQNLKIVWEAKGSMDTIDQSVIDYAKQQKIKEPANIAFASFATIKSQSITKVVIEDPTSIPENTIQRKLSRIRHYVDTFNFIGQAELSRYFRLLGIRLEKESINFPEFDEKIDLYKKIKKNYVRIPIKGKNYLGSIERIGEYEESNFLYVGFDEKLISIDGFSNFTDYEEDIRYEQKNKTKINTFIITRDGICYGHIQDLALLEKNIGSKINIKKIPYYRDVLSIRDLDNMLHFQLEEEIAYLFRREGFVVKKESFEGDKRYDIVATKNGKTFFVEVKKGMAIKPFGKIREYKEKQKTGNFILITTMKLSDEDIDYAKNLDITIIDRKSLQEIIKKRKKISEFLKK
jgi:hypothetical protein